LLQKVCGTMDHYFTTTHTIINCTWSTNSLLCDNPRNKAPRTGLRHTSHTCRPWSFSGREMNKHSSGLGSISLASVGYDGSQSAQYLLPPHLVFQSNWGWGDLGFFQLLQSNSSPEGVWNLSGYIEPHMKITESNCWVLLDPGGGKTVSWSTWGYVDPSNSCWPYNLKCRRNPCASHTVPQCEASRGGCCHHKNSLLLVVGPC